MAAVTAAVVVQEPISAQVVGNAFVQQYYHILHHSPGLVFRFYQDISKLGRPEDDGSMSITTTMKAINEKILSLNYGDFKAEIKSVDAQESFSGGVHVLVTGYFTGKDNLIRNFSQSFFLAPQERGFFVLNDMFRYVESANRHDTVQVLATDVVAPVTPEQKPSPGQENHISEESIPPAEEANEGGVYDPLDHGNVPVVEEEFPVAEVVDEVQDDSLRVVESNSTTEDVPKKSYASILLHLKESGASFSPLAPVPQKPMAKSVEQVNQSPITAINGSVSSSDSVDNMNNQEREADGYSIYIKYLPMSATVALLADEFKKFGPIKNEGIKVIRNRMQQQGFCYGFLEFEEARAVQKAIVASPILIGGRQAVVEERRSTNSQGRFPSGRGSGFRNDGARGRGNYGGGRVYGRGDLIGKTEFNYRGGNRGGSSNHGGDGCQRADNTRSNAGRMNRAGGMSNGTVKPMTPRVPATQV